MLRERLEIELGLTGLPASIWGKLATLDALLVEYGRAVDLSGFRSEAERHLRYFGEALAVAEELPQTGDAIDIGSGGGTPALPLAAARPSVVFSLVESNVRKALFLEEAAEALELENVRVLNGRYPDAETPRGVSAITLRGVSLTPRMRERALADLGPSGRLLWFSSAAKLRREAVELPTGFSFELREVGRGHVLVVQKAV